ncbi:uncharacterized protein [Epargyreus clarus]|uniref:uncharacterized protein n=1 Tax=Epargyreus clarus TaxID=520877 RepID=UPI003C2B84A3
MDPLEDLSCSRNTKQKCDDDKGRNCKNAPVQRGQGNDDQNVFTSMSHETDSSFVPWNGPQSRLSATSSNDCASSSNYSKEKQCVNVRAVNEPQMSNYASNLNAEFSEPSCSKVDSNFCDKGSEPNLEQQSCQRHKVCIDKVGNSSYNVNTPSTSGTSKSGDNNVSESSGFRESRKRPSSLKLNRSNLDAEESSSDTGNDDYSLGSEDGCIYTYRGGEHLADLPSSFFSLDMGLPLDRHLPMPPNYPLPQQAAPNAREGSRASSPDMDFLEMDFDPGPSCEVDTGDESTPDVDLEGASIPEENEPAIRGTSPEYLPGARHPPILPVPVQSTSDADPHYYNVPSTSRGLDLGQGDIPENVESNDAYGPYITHVNVRGEQFLVRRTMMHWPMGTPANLHVSSGDLVSPREILNYDEEHAESALTYQINQGEKPTFEPANLSSALYHLTMAKRLMLEKTKADVETQDIARARLEEKSVDKDSKPEEEESSEAAACVDPPRCMVWSEREACERQVTQIGTSACGATAVVNVFIALGVPVNLEKINAAVGTRLRANNAPLPRYLLSRSVAGCTAADLVTGIQRASDGLVTARFFPTYPERAMSLSHWLADWISIGAVPILTLNLQMGCEGEIPDAWHHQMVFGVSSHGVYLCNPVECVPETTLWPRLTSPSVLLVRARDVLARFTANTDLTPLMAVPDRRFHTFNVLGQVANVIREWRATGWSEHGTRTRLVRLPAAYQAGVTLAAPAGSEAHRRLVHAAPPPVLRATQ